jgi:hypothetical protein
MSPAASRTFCPLQDSAAAAAACPSSGDAFAAGFGGSQSQVALSRRMPPWADVCRAGRARAGGMRVCLVSCVRAGSTMSDVRGNNSLTAESESTSKDSSTYMGPPLDGRPDPTNLGTTVGRRAAEAPAAKLVRTGTDAGYGYGENVLVQVLVTPRGDDVCQENDDVSRRAAMTAAMAISVALCPWGPQGRPVSMRPAAPRSTAAPHLSVKDDDDGTSSYG